MPSERYGEEVMAWVKLREGATLTEDELVAATAAGKIATYKIPRYWKFVDGFPMTVTGKIQKFRMREVGGRGAGTRGRVGGGYRLSSSSWPLAWRPRYDG